MTQAVLFRTARLSGRAPHPKASPLYDRLFGTSGSAQIHRDLDDWKMRAVAPWTLAHAGHDVGVGGFRIGFGDVGLELSFHFLPQVWGLGLASEFVHAALDHARDVLQEDRVFARVEPDNAPSLRVLEKVGFTPDASADGPITMRFYMPMVTREAT